MIGASVVLSQSQHRGVNHYLPVWLCPNYNRGCHTFSEVREWVLGEWRMRKKRSQKDSFSEEKGVTPLCGLLGEWRMQNGEWRPPSEK